MSPLILPGSFEYEMALGALPLGWQHDAHRFFGNYAFVADSETGLLRTVDGLGFQEYLLGGEYEERLAAMGYEDDEDSVLTDWGDLTDVSDLEFCWIDF